MWLFIYWTQSPIVNCPILHCDEDSNTTRTIARAHQGNMDPKSSVHLELTPEIDTVLKRIQVVFKTN